MPHPVVSFSGVRVVNAWISVATERCNCTPLTNGLASTAHFEYSLIDMIAVYRSCCRRVNTRTDPTFNTHSVILLKNTKHIHRV